MKFIIASLALMGFFAMADFKKEKSEFISRAKEGLTQLDREIDQMGAKVNAASGKTKEHLTNQVESLKQKRGKLKTDLDALAKSSNKAWEQLKDGFENAWGELRASVKKASTEFRD